LFAVLPLKASAKGATVFLRALDNRVLDERDFAPQNATLKRQKLNNPGCHPRKKSRKRVSFRACPKGTVAKGTCPEGTRAATSGAGSKHLPIFNARADCDIRH